jgi:peptidoglycan hydrolase CwlO-like protein
MLDAQSLNNLLTILQILSLVGGGFYFLWRVESKLTNLMVSTTNTQSHLDKVDARVEKLSDVVIQLAKQEERMDAMDSRIQELSNRITSNSSTISTIRSRRGKT